MKSMDIDKYASRLGVGTKASVLNGVKGKAETRTRVMARDFAEPNANRKIAGAIKQHCLDHLDRYLAEAESSLVKNGAQVHWACDSQGANEIIHGILSHNDCRRMVKAKSMVSEETELLPYLEKRGIEVWETDLGEFIVQLDKDHPSHIVSPIIHKNRKDIATCFERSGLGKYNEDPETITRRARAFFRDRFMKADVGLTGANFVVAESGRICVVTNEGNGRFCSAAPRILIVLVGIEKVIPRNRDLSVFLSLLGRSATGQALSVYTQFINGPRVEGALEGPEQMHVVFLDNKRSKVLASEYREILRCIRCGACLNVCPVYRQASGHGYRAVYSGPVGAVLTPLLKEKERARYADLPKASSLCGACNEVCPVDIPIPELLLRSRNDYFQEGVKLSNGLAGGMSAWLRASTNPTLWKAAIGGSQLINLLPKQIIDLVPFAHAWQENRPLPSFRGGSFRKWYAQRRAGVKKS